MKNWIAFTLLSLSTSLAFAKTPAFDVQGATTILTCQSSSHDFMEWQTHFAAPNEKASKNKAKFVNELNSMSYRYRLPFTVTLLNSLDNTEVSGNHVVLHGGKSIYLEIDWAKYPKLHQQYQSIQAQTFKAMEKALNNKDDKALDNLPSMKRRIKASEVDFETMYTTKPKTIKVVKEFGFQAMSGEDWVTEITDKGYVGCTYPQS